ncbi:MAG: helicase HerA-like domain-containing protein, partial [Panacibacter sp.]
GLLLDSTILKEAYSGYSYEKPGQKNYGLGWRLKEFPDSSKIIYHNGWWRGYNTLFVRMPEQGTCIIVLANKYNRVVDSESAYEILNAKLEEAAEKTQQQQQQQEQVKQQAKEQKTAPKEKSFFDSAVVKQVERTAASIITRSLLGALGLGGRSSSKKKSWF